MKIVLGLLDFVWQGIRAGSKWLAHRGRWKLAAVAITAILVAILIHQVRAGHKRETALREDLAASQGEVQLLRDAREADSRALAERDAVRTDITEKENKGRAKTEAALAANPNWANQPVPAAVLDSLRE